MAGLFDKQAEVYSDARPKYPREWYSMLSALTPHHYLAWDAGTGNGQAAIGVAEFYDQVIGTDVSQAQLKCVVPHPRVKYIHTPLSISDHEIISMFGGEGLVDLVTVAQAVHWFDLPSFYSIVTRLLRKPGGIIAVWGYKDFTVDDAPSSLEPTMRRFFESTLPYWNRSASGVFDGYKTLPFPFESVGIGSEGKPLLLEMKKEVPFQGYLGMIRSWSAVNTAKEQGVDLLHDGVVKEFESSWGGPDVIRTLTYKVFMLAGTVPKQE